MAQPVRGSELRVFIIVSVLIAVLGCGQFAHGIIQLQVRVSTGENGARQETWLEAAM